MPDPYQRVAVFDLDGTLVRGDSFARFLRLLLLRRPIRAVISLLSAIILVPLFLISRTRRRAVAGFLWLATIGVPPHRFEALAEEFALAHAAEPRRIAITLDRLRSHQRAGDRVIIVTGCADPLAGAVCRALGLAGVEVIAARLEHSRRAHRVAEGCLGADKVRRLEQAGVVPPIEYAYSDSAVDLPLLRAAKHPVLVGPSPRTRQRVRAALGADPAVLPLD
ncbi:HAD-IB family phosphatase [Nonomuraea sp. NPDC049504]|uniref:HAD-IB family phosphatase n=1 Tax=Nonomuraea sp. NPDC049504 TaxID=3154729 RepID=UPI003415FC62